MTLPLIDRLREAKEGSRELDAELCALLRGGEIAWEPTRYTGEVLPVHIYPSSMHVRGFAREHVPLYTDSLDAALALVREKLPGTYWTLNQNYWPEGGPRAVPKAYTAEITNLKYRDDDPERIYAEEPASTPALALCITLLSALHQHTAEAGEEG